MKPIPNERVELLAELAAERCGELAPADLAATVTQAGVLLALKAIGPTETIAGLATLLRQLGGEFPDAWATARVKLADPGAGNA